MIATMQSPSQAKTVAGTARKRGTRVVKRMVPKSEGEISGIE